MPPPRPRAELVLGPDGQSWGKETSEEIDSILEGTFTWGSGPRALAYLESITTRRVLGPESTDTQLRHLEGARWLVGVIRQRMENHRRKKTLTKPSGEPDGSGSGTGRRGRRRVGQ